MTSICEFANGLLILEDGNLVIRKLKECSTTIYNKLVYLGDMPACLESKYLRSYLESSLKIECANGLLNKQRGWKGN